MKNLLTENSYSNYILVGLGQGFTLGELVENIVTHLSNIKINEKGYCHEFELCLFGESLAFYYTVYASANLDIRVDFWVNEDFFDSSQVCGGVMESFKNSLFIKILKYFQTSKFYEL